MSHDYELGGEVDAAGLVAAEREREVAELRGELDAAVLVGAEREQRVREVAHHLRDLLFEREVTNLRLEAANSEIETLMQSLSESEVSRALEKSSHSTETSILTRERDEIRLAAGEMNATLQQIFASRSWRLSAALRRWFRR